ncbi:MAG TPA: HU family DNA-binding protein [Oligoflexia bacterium]|nr:HU family DNA-binding protein [Oligoflexia bacterium]HMP26537.1 HU family DNA-binding protein [Oligoflexia bacterium]
MNKSDLIRELAQNLNLQPYEAETAVESIFNAMEETLINGGRIELRGLGSISVKQSKPRAGQDPRNRKEILVPAKRRPFFKVGKELKERIDR